MVSLAFTLLITSAISFAFRNTRSIGIACLSLFCFLFPVAALVLFAIGAVGLFIYYQRWKRRRASKRLH